MPIVLLICYMEEDNNPVGRRNALKTIGAIGISASSVPVVSAAKDNSATKTVELDTEKFTNVDRGVTRFDGDSQTTILSGTIDTTKPGQTHSYHVAIENGSVPEHAQAKLKKVASNGSHSHSHHEDGVHASGEETQERDSDTIGTSDHSSKDTGNDYEGGAVVRTGPSYERKCVTKQFVRWTSQNGAVDWAWRGWCSWHGINWETLMDGFADEQFESDGEYYTKSLGDYSPIGENDKVYHRVKLWAEPDGQMRWEVVMNSKDSEFGENYGHTADVYTSDDPYDNC